MDGLEETMAGFRADWLLAWTGHKAVWEMTEGEWDALPFDEKMAMPVFGFGPSHSNYYLCVLHEAVWLGIGLGVRVWESLPRSYRSHLNWLNRGADPVTPVPKNAVNGVLLFLEGLSMIILELSDGIVIKRTIDTVEHVRIDKDGYISFWGETRLAHRKTEKPYCEFDINECRDLLKELDTGMAGVKTLALAKPVAAQEPPVSAQSKLVNGYGAFHGDLADHVRDLLVPVYNELAGIASGLDPIDAILLEHLACDVLKVRFAEDRIRRGIGMRKAEKKAGS